MLFKIFLRTAYCGMLPQLLGLPQYPEEEEEEIRNSRSCKAVRALNQSAVLSTTITCHGLYVFTAVSLP